MLNHKMDFNCCANRDGFRIDSHIYVCMYLTMYCMYVYVYVRTYIHTFVEYLLPDFHLEPQ